MGIQATTLTAVVEGSAREQGAHNYLQEIAHQQHEPVLLFKRAPLAAMLETLGAKGISVPDVFEPYQIHLPLYIGATTPRATSEVPHWHAEQAEAYVVLDGEAELLAKNRWDDTGWVQRLGRAGDLLVVQPEVCHWFRWRSTTGLALVFKAPQRAGVGRYPAGKVVCEFCPHYRRGCALPEGFRVVAETKEIPPLD